MFKLPANTFTSREAQTWGAGRVKLSDKDRRDVKKAKKEGRYAEAMLDRRAALKRSVWFFAVMFTDTNVLAATDMQSNVINFCTLMQPYTTYAFLLP